MHNRCANRLTGLHGFTLVEVLVALLIMSVLAALGWQGIDSMARTREVAQASTERTLRLAAVIAQLEADLAALENTPATPALAFDGAALRLTRRTPVGLQVVVWALREGRWQRWASTSVTRVDDLQQFWLASQQLSGQEPGHTPLLDAVATWQVYFYRGGWSNAQSSGDRDEAEAPGASASGTGASASGTGAAAAAARELLPTGVRVVLELPEGALTRDVALGPQP